MSFLSTLLLSYTLFLPTAAYQVVWGGDTATQSDIYAAIETAVLDGVDVISMSLGSAFNSYFRDLPLLSAARVGVVAALSAGNNGPAGKLPYYASLQNASPYYITVGARYATLNPNS